MDPSGELHLVQVATSQGAIVELWLPPNTLTGNLLAFLHRIFLFTDSSDIRLFTRTHQLQPESLLDCKLSEVLHLTPCNSEIVVFSPTSVFSYQSKRQFLYQAFAVVAFPGLGNYQVRMRLATSKLQNTHSRYYVGKRLIILPADDRTWQAPLMTVKLTCWPAGSDVEIEDAESRWKSLILHDVDLFTSIMIASFSFAVVLLRPNSVLVGCSSVSRKQFAVVAERTETLAALQMKAADTELEAAKVWLHKGAVTNNTTNIGEFSLCTICDFQLVYADDVNLQVKDYEGHTGHLICPNPVSTTSLYKLLIGLRKAWTAVESFGCRGVTYHVSNQSKLQVSEKYPVMLLARGDRLATVNCLETLNQYEIIIRGTNPRVKELKSALAVARGSTAPPKLLFTGKLDNSLTISQFGVKDRADLVLVGKNEPAKPNLTLKIQLSSKPFFSFQVQTQSSVQSLKESICAMLKIAKKGESRLFYRRKELKNSQCLSDIIVPNSRKPVLFVRPGEIVIFPVLGNKPICVIANPTDTVESLKEKVEIATGLTAANMEIYYGNRLLGSGTIGELRDGTEVEIRFPGEVELIVLPFRGKMFSISASNSWSIGSLKERLVPRLHPSPRLIYHGIELMDAQLVGDFGLQTGAVVTEIYANFPVFLLKTPSGQPVLDLCLHPRTKVAKIAHKLVHVANCNVDIILTKELADEDLLHPFLSLETHSHLFLAAH